MAWTAVSFTVDGNEADAWSDALLEAGALSVDVTDALAGTPLETPQFGEPGESTPGAWSRNVVAAMFVSGPDPLEIIADAAAARGWPVPVARVSNVEEQDWVRLTQSQFEPIRISDRIRILPSWRETEGSTEPDAVNLIIDPGLAFGTGSHPTTRLCLQWLEAHVQAGDRVLDYGCGSGILSIAAKRLGAGGVVGTDVDVQAIEASRSNAAINRVECTFVTPDALGALGDGRYDVIVANILTNPLRMLAPVLAVHIRSGGQIVLSGILTDQAAMVIDAYARWFNIDTWRTDEGWAALGGTRR